MVWGAWWATVHGVTRSQTRLSDRTTTTTTTKAYVYNFFTLFSIMVYHRIINTVISVLYSKVLFIYSTCNTLHLPVPNSQSFRPLHLSLLATTSHFLMSSRLFLSPREVHLSHILDSTRKWYHMYLSFSVWLTSPVWESLGSSAAAAVAKSLQSCLTLCDPIDGSAPGSPIPEILQTRTLEWVAISFSKAWKWKAKVKSLSHVQLLATPWTTAHQAPPSMGFSRQEYWSGLPLPFP